LGVFGPTRENTVVDDDDDELRNKNPPTPCL